MARPTRALVALLAVLAAAAVGAGSAFAAGNKFSGEATPISISALGPGPIELGATKKYGTGSDAFADHNRVVDAQYPIAGVPDITNGAVKLDAELLHATIVSGGNNSRSEARVADVVLQAGDYTITADLISAEARARCTQGGAVVSSDVEIVNLVVKDRNGQVVAVSDELLSLEGKTIDLGAVSIQFGADRGTHAGDAEDATAIEVIVRNPLTGAELARVDLAKVHADITCALVDLTCERLRMYTGGGQIVPTKAAVVVRADGTNVDLSTVEMNFGSKATFAAAGRDLSPWGHLNYIDHDLRLHAKGRPDITVFVDGLTAVTEGGLDRVTIKGSNGSYQLTRYVLNVSDVDEPGKGRDTFTIVFFGVAVVGELSVLSGAQEVAVYAATGPTISAGNIQFHRCK